MLAPGHRAQWTFVVGQGFLAAVPVDAPAAVIEKLSAEVTLPVVKLESLVALLPLAGEHKIESFVVIVAGEPVDDDGVPVSIVVRGDIAAEVYSVGGSRRFSDRGIRPWLLAEFQAVVGIDIVPADAAESAGPTARPARGVPIGIGTVSGSSLAWSLNDAAGEGAGVAALDHRTDTSRAQPTMDGVWYGLRLPAGDERRIDSVFLLGRRPRQLDQSTGAKTDKIALIPLASATSAVSATHLEIRLNGGRVMVTDLDSTNGSTLTYSDGRSERMRPGVATEAAPGTRVDVGDGNIVEILPASER
ncbi:FHA domain-containing protein [Leifsonia kafniensis]